MVYYGAGGSIRLDGADIEVGYARVDGGTNNSDGSDGYIAVYYQNSMVIDTVDYALNVMTNVTATPEPTVVVVPTIDPATAVWHSRTYNYGSGHPNRIKDTTDGDAYGYDANGNQVSRLVGGVTQTLVYNAENRLSGVSDDIGNSESYLYDGDGVRVGRVRAGEATYLFMGGMYELTVEIPSGTVTDTKSYYTAAGQVIAVRDTDGLSTLLTDHLGSVLGEVDGLGALVGEQRYLPFGGVRTDLSGVTTTDISFTAQRSLIGTGLLDYHARQYDPALRTFIQPDSVIPDPYDVQDWNRYAYVHSNPVNYVDPSGNRPCGDGEAIDCDGKIYPTPPLVNNPIEPIQPLNPTVVLGGSCGQASIEQACLDPGAEDVSIWASDPWGNDALIIPYPGSKWGQATSLENYGFFDNLILIGYSAGADSALMYGLSHMLKALVLLGPTFSGKIDGQTNLNLESSLNVIDRLVESGTNVVIVDDSGDLNKGMFPPEVMFVPYDNKRKHYGAYSNIEAVVQDRSTPTNLNYWLKDLIWTFIVNN